MRPSRVLVAFLVFSLTALPLLATIGTIDVVPAATILIPYFEVDPSDPDGMTTIVGIQNESATAIIAHMILWTDYGLPTLTYNIYLTGYDSETLDLRDILAFRATPFTASAGQDYTDTISPKGPLSQDINFATCAHILPRPVVNLSPGTEYQHAPMDLTPSDLAAAHSGQRSEYFHALCGSHDYGDGRLRGYVTFDTVYACNYDLPSTPGYFVNGGGGMATSQNVMLGEYAYVDRSHGIMVAHPAVHIEADFGCYLCPPDLRVRYTGEQKYTFYGRFVDWMAIDNREPLPVAWNATLDPGRTTIRYWRDPGQYVAPFECGAEPAPFPLGQKQALGFDSEENPTPLTSPFFPLAAGAVGPGAFPLSFKTGWLFANLNLPAASGPMGTLRQSWLTFERTTEALPSTTPFEVGYEGTQQANAIAGSDPTISGKGGTR